MVKNHIRCSRRYSPPYLAKDLRKIFRIGSHQVSASEPRPGQCWNDERPVIAQCLSQSRLRDSKVVDGTYYRESGIHGPNALADCALPRPIAIGQLPSHQHRGVGWDVLLDGRILGRLRHTTRHHIQTEQLQRHSIPKVEIQNTARALKRFVSVHTGTDSRIAKGNSTNGAHSLHTWNSPDSVHHTGVDVMCVFCAESGELDDPK